MTTTTLRRKPKILAVDDDKDVLFLLESVLKRAGFEVVVATDGAEAMDFIKAECPDVVLLDLMMPVMSGFSVLEELKQRGKGPRVVCLTARAEPEGREKAWRLGADEYVTKPFKLEGVVKVVNEVSKRDFEDRESRRRSALDDLSWT